MSWASHPTNEMPERLAGQHRRRSSSVIGITAAAVLLVLAVVGAMLSPSLLGWPPPSSPAAGEDLAETGTPPSPDGKSAALRLVSVAPSHTAAPTTPPASPTPVKTTKRPPTTPSPAPGIQALEDEVVRLTNIERASNSCPALRVDSKLRTAARQHSGEMAATRELTHTGVDGSSPDARMRRAGYDTRGGWAENVASGYPTPEAVMTGWMKSEGHRDNILNCSLKAIGVGVARAGNNQLYWTQDFGGR